MGNRWQQTYRLESTIEYSNRGKSSFYVKGNDAIIIDDGICNCQEYINYSVITDIQNNYMHRYRQVYRFLQEDIDTIDGWLEKSSDSDTLKPTGSRENSPDSSPLEFFFEENFAEVYGSESLVFLNKEYGITDEEGRTFYLDYLVHTLDGDIAIEENGLHYHHPQLIGIEKYRRQLQKQNTCSRWGIKLYRFSTEDCKFKARIQDDIRRFLGQDTSCFRENGILVHRKVKLYDHQEQALKEIRKGRAEGNTTSLIVLPTAAGKSKIVEEDLQIFAQEKPQFKGLILAPNKNIITDWEKRLEENLPGIKGNIDVKTYSFLSRHYREYPQTYYNYIVADEAHHTVAPTYKRVIQYFTPDFLIGLTATDQRPDKQKLENIFGAYKTTLSLPEAMKQGIIAQAHVYRIETNIDLSHVRFNGTDYVNADLEKKIRITSRNDLIVSVLEEYFSVGFEKEQGLIFCVNTAHSKEMASLLNRRGLNAASYTSKEKNCEKIMDDFKAGKLRFLCTCNMISEGWDYPSLKIIVMARPTLSKVLYLQQIGRGLRKTSLKENMFVIDVVDEYGAMVQPCSMHSIFKNPYYVPFGAITERQYKPGDMILVDGLTETIEKITEINIEDFSEKYKDYLSSEQVAREFFISTDTLLGWIKKNKVTPDVAFTFGTKKLYMFTPQTVAQIKIDLQLKEHNEQTLYSDFFEFLEQRDYSLSYKMPFFLSLLKNINEIGEAVLQDVLEDYISFYQSRIRENLPVDKRSCPYAEENLKDKKFIKQNMLTNPFEKFKRKRFLYLCKDLAMIAIVPSLWEKLQKNDFIKIKKQLFHDLQNYYVNLGGLQKTCTLLDFAKEALYEIKENVQLRVADSQPHTEGRDNE